MHPEVVHISAGKKILTFFKHLSRKPNSVWGEPAIRAGPAPYFGAGRQAKVGASPVVGKTKVSKGGANPACDSLEAKEHTRLTVFLCKAPHFVDVAMLEYLKALFAFLDPAVRAQKQISHAAREAAEVERCLEKGIDALLTEKVRLLKKATALPARKREDFRETMDTHFTHLAEQMKERFSPLNWVFKAIDAAAKTPDLGNAHYIRAQVARQHAVATALRQHAMHVVSDLQLTLDRFLSEEQPHAEMSPETA